MAAPQFTLKVGDGLGAHIGEEEEFFRNATAIFTPNIKEGHLVLVDGKLRTIPSVTITLDSEGKINGDIGIELLAFDESLGIAELQWKITVKNARAQGFQRGVREWWITAGEDGDVIDLADVPPVVGSTAIGRAPRTYVVPVDANDPNTLYQWKDEYGNNFGAPVSLDNIITEAVAAIAAANAAPEAVDNDLASRGLGFVDEGGGEGYFTVGGIPISGNLVPPGGLWSSVAARPQVTPNDFGAVGDGVTDDAAALDATLNYCAVNPGTAIMLRAGITYASSQDFQPPSYTQVVGNGRLKCLDDSPGGRGAFVLMVNGVHDITWDGPSVDGNFKLNANPIAIGTGIGFDPETSPFNDNIFVRATVMNARVFTLDVSVGWVTGGGGKGFTVQGRTRNLRAEITAINCDFGASMEAGTTEGRECGNNILNLIAMDCARSPLLIYGSTPVGFGTSVSAGAKHAQLPGLIANVWVIGGNTADITDPTDDVTVKPNYEYFGMVTSQFATGCRIHIHCSTAARASVLRGKFFGCHITGDVYMDELQDVYDSRPIEDAGTTGSLQLDNIIELKVHATNHRGIAHRHTGHNQRTTLDIDFWCENGVGSLYQPDAATTLAASASIGEHTLSLTASVPAGLYLVGAESVYIMKVTGAGPYTAELQNATTAGHTSGDAITGTPPALGASVDYNFRDMKSSPIKWIEGESAVNSRPSWSLAPNGGHVILRRVIHTVGNFATAAAGDTTPTVTGDVQTLTTANVSATSISFLDDGYRGQPVTIVAGDANTSLTHSSTFVLRDNKSVKLRSGASLSLRKSSSTVWTETSRSSQLSVTGSLNFGVITPGNEESLTLAFAGVLLGDNVNVSIPVAARTTGVIYHWHVSAGTDFTNGVVTVTAVNISSSDKNPAAGVFKAALL